MDTPRCATCRHWTDDHFCELTRLRPQGVPAFRTKAYCWPTGAVPAQEWEWFDTTLFELKTEPDFGCVQHQPKEQP